MEIQSAFDLVAEKVEKALAEQDYKKTKCRFTK